MTAHATTSPQLIARTAGGLYLGLIVVGAIGYFIGASFLVPGDAAATATNILASEPRWRLAIVALLVMLACDVAVAALFYVLFVQVSRPVAMLAVGFRLVQASLQAVAVLARLAPVTILRDAPSKEAFSPDQLQALSRLSLRLFEQGFELGLLFFGVDCLAVGWLILRSRFLPPVLGVAVILAGLCYLTDGVVGLLFPSFDFPFDILLLAYLAELALCLWLLVLGIDEAAWWRGATRELDNRG
jgi:hypothetical protein